MLEKIAEMVSAEDVIYNEDGDYPCELCAHFRAEPDCYRKFGCPQALKERRLMLARWAVLLVARGLETLPDAKEQDLRQLKSGKKLEDRDKTEQAEYVCAMSNLGIDFMNLLTDATISAREAKEVPCTKG